MRWNLLRVKIGSFPLSVLALSMALFTANRMEELMHCGGSPEPEVCVCVCVREKEREREREREREEDGK